MEEKEPQKCRECGKETKDWIEDGAILVNEDYEQAYACKKCWDSREYVCMTIECKSSKQAILFDD